MVTAKNVFSVKTKTSTTVHVPLNLSIWHINTLQKNFKETFCLNFVETVSGCCMHFGKNYVSIRHYIN